MARYVRRTVLAAWTVSLVLAAPAGAKLFTVTSTADSDAAGATNDGVCMTASDGCTLRAAIREANGTPGPDEIALPARHYVLTSPLQAISTDVTINGEGAAGTIVDGAGVTGVFNVTGGTVAINGVAITGGGGASPRNGISVQGTSTVLSVDRVAVHDNVLSGNFDQAGAGIDLYQGSLTVTRSAIYNNRVVATNNSQAQGAGVHVNAFSTTATFDTTTIANNSAESNGGSTFGGGIASTGPGITLRHVTMTGNRATFGANLDASNLSHVVLVNSALTDPAGGTNCGSAGTPVASSKNLASDTSCNLPAGSPIATGAFEAFGDYGGLTPSAPPKAGSPALDVATACPDGAKDQRGQVAPVGAACDLGAAELGADVSTTLTASASSVDAGESLTYFAVVRNNGLDATSGSLEFTPPGGSSVTFASSLGGSCDGTAPVVCSHGTLAPGGSFAATIVVKAPATGPITGSVHGTGTVADFDSSNNTASVMTAVVPAPTPPDKSDKTKPILGGLRIVGKPSRKRGARLSYVLSENATLTIRLGKLGTQTRSGKAGEHTLKLSGRWGKKLPKRGKKYKLTVVATDAAGNKSRPKTLTLRVRRP